MDQETWDQIGEACQELIQKMKSASFAGGFTIKCELKEKGTQLWRKEAEIPSNYSQTYPASEFSRYKNYEDNSDPKKTINF